MRFFSCKGDSREQRLTFLVFMLSLGLDLRDCVSLFNHFETTNEQIQELSGKSQECFRANALFLPTSVNPAVWTLGNIVPANCKEVFQRYGQGLCMVNMEGRKAKHIFLKKLSENSSFQRQWYDIFKHELIMSIWLPEKGFDTFVYKPNRNVYISSRVFDNGNYCYCGLEKADPADESCYFCGDQLYKAIQDSVWAGKILATLAWELQSPQ